MKEITAITLTGKEIGENNIFEGIAKKLRSSSSDDETIRTAVFYEALSMIEQSEGFSAVLDTGLFNDFIRSYCILAMHEAGIGPDRMETVLMKLPEVFDRYTAAEGLNAAERLLRQL